VALAAFDRAYAGEGVTLAGVDEAGRGPLAGPVVAAACIIDCDIDIVGINDSKKLTPVQRRYLFERLIADERVIYGVGIVDRDVIDEINILQATIRAMIEALDNLSTAPTFALVDGMAIPHPTIPNEQVIKGDAKSLSIAAASIIAKETRDRIMVEYHEKWPEYGFDKHKGYGTQKHRDIIQDIGPCPIHRRSFEPVRSMVSG